MRTTEHGLAASADSFGPLAVLIAAVSIAMLWVSAGDHALYPPDEGRYAAVSMHMADEGDWLTPRLQGEAHLNKPPLAYWMQAAALKAIGHEELAVRAPSLLASSITIVLVLLAGAVAQPHGSLRLGALAAGVLACMPLHVMVGRMAITDPILSMSWFAALLAAVRVVGGGSWRWNLMLWFGIAVGLLAKGPLALMPLAVVLVWLALARNLRAVGRLHPLIGLPLAAAPVLAWAALVVRAHPEAVRVWLEQTAGRIVGEEGTNAHAAPPWYYVPVFFAGLFPATIMLRLPGLNIRWRDAWQRVRGGDERAFWIIALVLPLAFFTIMSGKLATYLLPLAGPASMLAAMTLDNWVRGAWDRGPAGDLAPGKPPEIVVSLLVTSVLLAGGVIAATVLWLRAATPYALTMAVLPATAGFLCWLWKRRHDLRFRGLALTWAAGCIAWLGAFEVEDDLRAPSDQRALVEHLRQITGGGQPHIVLYGLRDQSIEFYARTDVVQAEGCHDLLAALEAAPPQRVIILADHRDWERLDEERARCTANFVLVERRPRWFRKTVDVLRPASALPSPR